MATLFKTISKKIINIDNHPLLQNYDQTDGISPVIKTFFTNLIYLSNPYSTNKFSFFYETYNSIFLNTAIKDEFTILFSRIQKVYNAFSKVAFMYKFKKAPIVVNTDLLLSEINENDKNIVTIFHDGSKYLFNIKDLIHIIDNSITNSPMFFYEPTCVKNPFNNLAFNKSTLYNIYFFIKFKTNMYPELVFKYFQTNFDLTLFLYRHESFVKEYAINNYATKSPQNTIYNEIRIMINWINKKYIKRENKILIDADFPKDKLIKIMKPYLLLYLKSIYSLIPLIKQISKIELECKLQKFQQFNRTFGKKNAVMKYLYDGNNINNFSIINSYVFNDKHILFNESTDFLTSHLSTRIDNIYYNIDNNDDENDRMSQSSEDESVNESDTEFDSLG